MGREGRPGNRAITGPVWAGRIISEDDDFVIIEIPKSLDTPMTLDSAKENNRFITFAFTDGLPWEK